MSSTRGAGVQVTRGSWCQENPLEKVLHHCLLSIAPESLSKVSVSCSEEKFYKMY